MGLVILIMDFNCLFLLEMDDFGQYLKISDKISSVYPVMDYSGLFGLTMVDFGWYQKLRQNGLTSVCI